MTISYEVDDKAFRSMMKSLKSSTKKLEPAFRDFGKYMTKETQKQFKTEVDPDGDKWAPLSPSTLAKKKTTFILRETGFMYSKIFYEASNTEFKFGINDPKYKYHHFGTNKMPARVVVGVGNERRAVLNNYVRQQIKRVSGLNKKRRKK